MNVPIWNPKREGKEAGNEMELTGVKYTVNGTACTNKACVMHSIWTSTHFLLWILLVTGADELYRGKCPKFDEETVLSKLPL